jgi:hypothetical protein
MQTVRRMNRRLIMANPPGIRLVFIISAAGGVINGRMTENRVFWQNMKEAANGEERF